MPECGRRSAWEAGSWWSNAGGGWNLGVVDYGDLIMKAVILLRDRAVHTTHPDGPEGIAVGGSAEDTVVERNSLDDSFGPAIEICPQLLAMAFLRHHHIKITI